MNRAVEAPARTWVPLFIAVCLVAINMRMTITGIGPLLGEIAEDQGVSATTLGLLASIPLLTWAIVSPLAQGLAARIGIDASVSWALVVLMVATAWRSLPGSPVNLWLGTALIGAALAITNVLLPAAIKRDFGRRVPLVMGVYSALLGGAAAIGAGIVAPISHLGSASGDPLGWRWALLATGATIPIALAVWIWAMRRRSSGPRAPRGPGAGLGRRVWLDPVAWFIALYMGCQSWSFYIYATWLAPVDVSFGTDPVAAGFNLTIFHLSAVVGSLIAPFASRGEMQRLLPLVAPLMSIVGATGFVFVPSLTLFWFVICGLSCGLGLSIALTFVAQRSSSAEVASAVSGMSQSFGYLIASAGPIAFGWLHELTGGWKLALVTLLLGGAVAMFSGIVLARGRMVTLG